MGHIAAIFLPHNAGQDELYEEEHVRPAVVVHGLFAHKHPNFQNDRLQGLATRSDFIKKKRYIMGSFVFLT